MIVTSLKETGDDLPLTRGLVDMAKTGMVGSATHLSHSGFSIARRGDLWEISVTFPSLWKRIWFTALPSQHLLLVNCLSSQTGLAVALFLGAIFIKENTA